MFTKIKIGVCLLATLFLATTCSEKLIDIPPVNPTEQDYFKTEGEFTKGVFGVYARLSDLYNFNGGTGNVVYPIFFLPGDDVTVTGQNPFEHFSQLDPTNGRSDRYFNRLYQLIGRANTLLEKISAESGVYSTAGLKRFT